MFSKNVGPSVPCLRCNGTELDQLHTHFNSSDEEFWVYQTTAVRCCNRCRSRVSSEGCAKIASAFGIASSVLMASHNQFKTAAATFCVSAGLPSFVKSLDLDHQVVQVPIPVNTVGTIERAVQASCIASKGSDFRAHGTFISHLQLLDAPEIRKQSLCAWAPKAMIDFNAKARGAARFYRRGHLYREPATPTPHLDSSPPDGVAKIAAMCPPPPNNDADNGMMGTNVAADAYGLEDRVKGVTYQIEPKVLAHQIGPDLIPTEVMESSGSNLKAGLAKRVKPLGYKADAKTSRKIERTVNALIKEVFSKEKIREWRQNNPDINDFKSSKWSAPRWAEAVDEALADVNARIEQTFQIKVNEALPAKDKAPRPIIQCGDRAQAMMNLPVKCFEDLLFHHFEEASIKHLDKFSAMKRVAAHLNQPNAKLIEGDGSAWDSCCNPKIRSMTENRIIRHIILALGEDPQVPKSWMEKTLADMDKKYLKGKAKVSDFTITPLKVMIESIRQSGHRGTSCFNYLINLVCWLVVLCENPEEMIKLGKNGLRVWYKSPRDGKWYTLKYSFEGDDSAISTTENLEAYAEDIEKIWTNMGFRMKLIYVKEKLTFTGYDFLVDENGPTGMLLPEICRNIASSSWTCSSIVKSDPGKRFEVGMNAMLARAINFRECGPISKYFASLGLAHAKWCGDMVLGEDDAKRLGIRVSHSVVSDLQDLYQSAEVMSAEMRKLVNLIVPFTQEEELRMLTVDFHDPFDLQQARMIVPHAIWDPEKYSKPRR